MCACRAATIAGFTARGVFEYRIDFGPGYRIYFGKDGAAFVILLGGSEAPVARDCKEEFMALTRHFRLTVAARAQRDPKYRQAQKSRNPA